MALKKYIGARYTPKFMGAWDAQTVYAALSVVYANEQSYVSRKTVPAGTELTNTEYWIKSADWNAQVAEYNRNVENYNKNVVEYNKNVEAYQQAVSTFYADTLHSYDTKAAMVADQDLKLGDTLLTCGNTAIGDGGGSFYQVVAETSAKAVALENGLYALPFEFQPYDFSEFQTEVDNYKKDTDQQIKTFENTVKQDVAQMKEVSLHTYNTQNQMKADETLTPNTVVMTAGEAAIGDNKGSFYNIQETSDKTDAVPLANGRKAVPFALNVGTVAGNALTFNGKSEVAGIWNVKAPASLTIPLTIPQGGTALTYLAVMYTSTSTSVTANVTVNGTGQELTFTDKADDGYEKFVVYAITCKNTDQIYWSKSTVTSWQTEYKTGSISYTSKFGANAPAELKDIAFSFTSDLVFKPTKDIIIDSVTVKLPAGNYINGTVYHSGVSISIYDQNASSKWNTVSTDYSTPTAGTHTFNLNSAVVLKANTYYRLEAIAYNTSIGQGRYITASVDMSVQNGTFDLIDVSKPSDITQSNNFNGIIAYHTAI
mgnify:CR=1 FL=1